jgi:hypothetical protein
MKGVVSKGRAVYITLAVTGSLPRVTLGCVLVSPIAFDSYQRPEISTLRRMEGRWDLIDFARCPSDTITASD